MRPLRSMLALLTMIAATGVVVTATEQPALAAPLFKAPFPCGQRWTYSHHSAEVRLALDFVRNDGGATAGTPVLASAGGTAYRFSQPSGAGNYIAVEHGGGWKTYYFHLASYSVANGASVAQGQQIGITGATGNTSGAHIHYEQLLNGVGQTIVINGGSLAPYPGSYGSKSLTSDNGCGGSSFMTWGSGVRVRSDARLAAATVATLAGPTRVTVLCQKQGDWVSAEGYSNNWWSKLASPAGFITNIYIDHPAAQLPGVPVC
ncbi:hypothetical protein F4553_001693 [Allocatelliglobosispora scoriae]|uniref:M23ase beta-sheet core domain-containing protein n=1 Tax=Allocatelliglobosispora scoriae TaxID=643052 RepID=A0A841BJ80_9ACTN|nr:hypothetical protein [Allocatelliglobosispora scoriae]